MTLQYDFINNEQCYDVINNEEYESSLLTENVALRFNEAGSPSNQEDIEKEYRLQFIALLISILSVSIASGALSLVLWHSKPLAVTIMAIVLAIFSCLGIVILRREYKQLLAKITSQINISNNVPALHNFFSDAAVYLNKGEPLTAPISNFSVYLQRNSDGLYQEHVKLIGEAVLEGETIKIAINLGVNNIQSKLVVIDYSLRPSREDFDILLEQIRLNINGYHLITDSDQ